MSSPSYQSVDILDPCAKITVDPKQSLRVLLIFHLRWILSSVIFIWILNRRRWRIKDIIRHYFVNLIILLYFISIFYTGTLIRHIKILKRRKQNYILKIIKSLISRQIIQKCLSDYMMVSHCHLLKRHCIRIELLHYLHPSMNHKRTVIHTTQMRRTQTNEIIKHFLIFRQMSKSSSYH